MKPIVREDTAQVVVPIEHDTEQVERLALVPCWQKPTGSVTDATTGISS
jgi:hypothetical protein